ncbi:DUF3021 family protein [Lacicoccus qingdaonensis]|uniref:DUF3021 domain-containing protein n=1 Tax=Lacicoccus qingdaonensis TaxID=576118 RepID=A0A1G9FEQ2_9BACL|nr:DUF3021 family protein [Salinicoccus qingdaonensis]SDK86935.1 Protein of unknown function [Salinicoccus qingdaonensis]
MLYYSKKGGILISLFVRGFFRGAALFSIFVLLSVWSLFIGPAENVRVFLYYGFIALFLGFGSVIFQVSEWPLIKQIFIHYITMLITVFPLLLIINYDTLTFTTDIPGSFIIFNIIQAVVILITYSLSKALKIFSSNLYNKER